MRPQMTPGTPATGANMITSSRVGYAPRTPATGNPMVPSFRFPPSSVQFPPDAFQVIPRTPAIGNKTATFSTRPYAKTPRRRGYFGGDQISESAKKSVHLTPRGKYAAPSGKHAAPSGKHYVSTLVERSIKKVRSGPKTASPISHSEFEISE